ncbi:hypothetical protein D5S17_04760 [Pseudonocardiaceae bacterium YIM PH 21723]|nr:hypothetical protein D5S17_04760 [Pseudonocardiaceae bacterium YIM PH 21723]
MDTVVFGQTTLEAAQRAAGIAERRFMISPRDGCDRSARLGGRGRVRLLGKAALEGELGGLTCLSCPGRLVGARQSGLSGLGFGFRWLPARICALLEGLLVLVVFLWVNGVRLCMVRDEIQAGNRL